MELYISGPAPSFCPEATEKSFPLAYQWAGAGTVEPLPVRAGLPTGGCSGMQPCVQRWGFVKWGTSSKNVLRSTTQYIDEQHFVETETPVPSRPRNCGEQTWSCTSPVRRRAFVPRPPRSRCLSRTSERGVRGPRGQSPGTKSQSHPHNYAAQPCYCT